MSQHCKSHSKGHKSLNEWLSYLETIHNTEIDLGLSRIGEVANRLAIDFSFATVITVAGTNGKGTTCAFLENALLNETGYNSEQLNNEVCVAVYSSPHIEHFNERLRVDRIDVDDQSFITAFEKIEETRGDISLSYYEYTTLAAFLILMVIKPSVIILEVGLGGRLDATNIIDADVSVVTTVDIDHQAFLGNDRETIGFEKAGIMRADQHIIIGDLCPPKSVTNHAHQVNQTLPSEEQQTALDKIKIREQDFTIYEQADTSNATTLWQWQFNQNIGTSDSLFSLKNLKPTHIPRDNVATALMVLKQLDVELTSKKVNQVIEQTKVAGRTELFSYGCDVMLDVGHNPHAARYLAAQLESYKAQNKYNNIIAVTSMLADKDISNTLGALSEHIESWYIAPLTVPRAATVQTMKAVLTEFTNSINCFDNVTQAFKIANQNAQEKDLILVFGSFFTVAEIRELLT